MRACGGDNGDDNSGDGPRPDDAGAQENGGQTRALDALLRDERAAVAVTVALANGAATYAGRTRLERLGGELVLLAAALRERLDLAGRAVPSGASPEAGVMLATESYDARLAALAHFLDTTAAHATEALAASGDGEEERTLRDLIAVHAQAAQWLRERAAAFAATRPADPTPGVSPHSAVTDAPGTASDVAPDGEPAPEDERTSHDASR